MYVSMYEIFIFVHVFIKQIIIFLNNIYFNRKTDYHLFGLPGTIYIIHIATLKITKILSTLFSHPQQCPSIGGKVISSCIYSYMYMVQFALKKRSLIMLD